MKKPQSDEELMTPEEVCKMLGGIHPATLREWNVSHRHKEILAPIRYSHRCVRYERAKVKAFIEKCRSVF